MNKLILVLLTILVSITNVIAQPPCPPFSPCWCASHPGHPNCNPVSVPIDTHIWVLIVAAIGMGVYFNWKQNHKIIKDEK